MLPSGLLGSHCARMGTVGANRRCRIGIHPSREENFAVRHKNLNQCEFASSRPDVDGVVRRNVELIHKAVFAPSSNSGDPPPRRQSFTNIPTLRLQWRRCWSYSFPNKEDPASPDSACSTVCSTMCSGVRSSEMTLITSGFSPASSCVARKCQSAAQRAARLPLCPYGHGGRQPPLPYRHTSITRGEFCGKTQKLEPN